MARLAIKGHETRGAEVIEILEMLGGINVDNFYGDVTYAYYFINKHNDIDVDDNSKQYLLFSLEEFLQRFPYKVGDKVQHKRATYCSTVYEIVKMWWNGNQVEYTVCDLYWKNIKCTETTENLKPYKPYKEETMENNIIDVVKESDNRYRIILNYQYDMEVDEGEYYAVRRKPQYPKTYEECCELLSLGEDGRRLFTKGYKASLIQDFQRLLICRDAYWRIAGEEMGLGKPLEPELNSMKRKFALSNVGGNISFEVYGEYNSILCFPTEEIRAAFYENFKGLIEIVKELL